MVRTETMERSWARNGPPRRGWVATLGVLVFGLLVSLGCASVITAHPAEPRDEWAAVDPADVPDLGDHAGLRYPHVGQPADAIGAVPAGMIAGVDRAERFRGFLAGPDGRTVIDEAPPIGRRGDGSAVRGFTVIDELGVRTGFFVVDLGFVEEAEAENPLLLEARFLDAQAEAATGTGGA